jgi:hypothetical protein
MAACNPLCRQLCEHFISKLFGPMHLLRFVGNVTLFSFHSSQ